MLGPMTRNKLLEEALQLAPASRARLARDLLASLYGPPDTGVEEAWARELKRRIQEVKEGKVKLIPWKVVRKRIEARLTSLRHRRS